MPGTEPNLLEDHLGCASSLSHFLVNDCLRRSLAYHRLPRPLVELSVLKLDGSSFEIQVAKMALVAEVKEAVEDFYKEFAMEGELEISWSHVWGHFCLSYNGQKLVDDKAYILNLGIKDGDQVVNSIHPHNGAVKMMSQKCTRIQAGIRLERLTLVLLNLCKSKYLSIILERGPSVTVDDRTFSWFPPLLCLSCCDSVTRSVLLSGDLNTCRQFIPLS